MSDRPCPYCQQLFPPSLITPANLPATKPTARSAAGGITTARRSLPIPSTGRSAVCLDSCHQWREEHPDYWKGYRQAHPCAAGRNRQGQQQRDQKRRLVHLANNHLELIRAPKGVPSIYLICLGLLDQLGTTC